MARTAITPIDAGFGADEAEVLTVIDQPNGMVINSADPDKTLLRVTNTDGAALNLIVRGGDNLIPAWMSGQGDRKFSVPATTGVVYAGPFDSARHLQSDGSLHIDFDASFAGKITAVLLP